MHERGGRGRRRAGAAVLLGVLLLVLLAVGGCGTKEEREAPKVVSVAEEARPDATSLVGTWDSLDAKAFEKRAVEIGVARGELSAEEIRTRIGKWVARGEEYGMFVPYALTLRTDGTCTYEPREVGRPGGIEGTWAIDEDGFLVLRKEKPSRRPGDDVFGLYRVHGDELWGMRERDQGWPDYVLRRR